MSNKVKSKSENKRVYKSLRYRLKQEDNNSKSERGAIRRFLSFVFHLIFNPITILLLFLLLLTVGLTFGYFWTEYSEKIDSLLRGEIFTQNAGIYSAPKTIKEKEVYSKSELLDYLTSAGYIEKNQQADESRSRFQIVDNQVNILPGKTAVIDDRKSFPSLQIKYAKDDKTILSITDLDANKQVNTARLEPKILSSIAGEGDGSRKTVSFNDIPQNLRKAIITTEDRAFFEHYGVNFRGIARALWRRYEKDDGSVLSKQGGSSITQQLVKNLLLTSEYSVERKLKEALMSFILETRLSKEEIFTLYANQIYLGQQEGGSIYGVGTAARSYFGKDVTELTLAESALIAGIIRSPNRYNPHKNPEKSTERRNQVLESMLEANQITPEEYQTAKSEELKLYQLTSKKDLQGMPYFTQYVTEQLPKIVNDPEAIQHLRVFTSIDPEIQEIANNALVNRLDKLDKNFPKKQKGSLQAALIAIRPKTGEIVAMVGGRNYHENQFNRATDAMRQPGSVFKPFVYATAINSAYDGGKLFTAATTIKDEKKTFTFNNESYSPNNYGDVFTNKETTLRDALVHSKNTITVDLAMQLNIGRVMNLATKAGFPKVDKAFPSMALGTAEATPLQVATAYTVFANLGDKVSPVPISRITTGEGKTVNALLPERKNILKPDVAYIMDDIMKDIINRGTAAGAQAWGFKNISGKQGFAGKTGTSRDGWFAGFTPDLICVVYVGFDENDELGMKGADSALPIWADFMRQVLNIHPEWNGDWSMPDSLQLAEIDSRDGKVLRQLDQSEANIITAQKAILKQAEKTPEALQTPEIISPFLNQVSPEFRRIELFVNGTLPVNILPETDLPEINRPKEEATPVPTPTPFTTWENAQNENTAPSTKAKPAFTPKILQGARSITVAICAQSGLRATPNCPKVEIKSFNTGSEPKEFCTLHAKPIEK